jgi:hypothetical protein
MTDLQDNIPQQNSNQPKPRTSRLVIVMIVLLIMIPVSWAGFSIFSWCRVSAHTMWCQEHFCNFRVAFYCYNDNDRNNLPLPENWCDVLFSECDISLDGLNCVESDTIAGESAYAMNANVVGRKLSELPSDMVFMFESDKGKEQARSLLLTERVFVQSGKRKIPDCYKHFYVYPLRWNQLGGPGDAAFRHRAGNAMHCHVLFADGRIELIRNDQIPAIRWNIDKEEPNKIH